MPRLQRRKDGMMVKLDERGQCFHAHTLQSRPSSMHCTRIEIRNGIPSIYDINSCAYSFHFWTPISLLNPPMATILLRVRKSGSKDLAHHEQCKRSGSLRPQLLLINHDRLIASLNEDGQLFSILEWIAPLMHSLSLPLYTNGSFFLNTVLSSESSRISTAPCMTITTFNVMVRCITRLCRQSRGVL